MKVTVRKVDLEENLLLVYITLASTAMYVKIIVYVPLVPLPSRPRTFTNQGAAREIPKEGLRLQTMIM